MADQQYHVIARKWRPASFSDVVGQEHVTRSLANAIRRGRIHHAYLFSGPRGVGKTSVARILAKALNCVDGPTDTPCLKCASCTSIAAGTSLDVMEIDGASNNNVDQVRDLRESLGYATAESRYRVVIIDEVHMLSRAAFNALLKTLEEPPSHVVFIFATTEPNKVIPTVQSRCQRHDFHRLTVAQIRSQLQRICESEGIRIDPGGIDLIAEHADGAMRDGESLLDQVAAATEGDISAGKVADLIGAVERTVYIGLLDAIARHDVAFALSVVSETINRGRNLAQFLAGLMVHLRHLLACGVEAESALSELEPSDRELLAEQARKFSERDLVRMLNAVAEAELALEKTAAPQVRVELALLKMAYMERTVELEDLMARLERSGGSGADRDSSPRARGDRAPRAAASQKLATPTDAPGSAEPHRHGGRESETKPSPDSPPEADEEGEVAAEALGEDGSPAQPAQKASLAVLSARWPEIASALKRDEADIAPWIQYQVKVTGFEEGTLVIGVESDFYAERLGRWRETIHAAVRERFPDVRDVSIIVESSEAQPATSERIRKSGSLVQGVVHDEPIVGKLIESLGLELYE